MDDSVDAPISPDPVVAFEADHLPAYVSNGVIGLRVLEVPFRRGVCVVNGLAGIHPSAEIEYAPHAPYPLAGDVAVGSRSGARLPECLRWQEQRYDFATGELTSRWRAYFGQTEVGAATVTFASRTHPTVVAQRTELTVSEPCRLTVSAIVAVGDIAGRCVARRAPAGAGELAPELDGWLRFEPPGGIAACGVALHSELLGADEPERSVAEWVGAGDLRTDWSFDAVPGRTYVLHQLASMVPTSTHHHAEVEAARLLAAAADLGSQELRRRNRGEWQELWRARIRLVGAPRCWQSAIDAAFFYLHSSTHPSSPASTHVFGMAQWHGYHYYYGHVMWDLEAFAVPVLDVTAPGAARALLDYRSRMFDVARQNARALGRAGMQVPWEAGPASGQESAPLGGLAVAYEDHATLAVALAFLRHSAATGDRRFEREQAWPVLAETAEWLASRVERTERGVEIRRALGVAERSEPHDNQAYLNLAAAMMLRAAVAMADRLGVEASAVWSELADGLVVPVDGDLILTHDGFDPEEEKGATPEPPAALTLFGPTVDAAVERATLAFFLERADEYVGNPMLSTLYGVWAARLGDRDGAATALDDGFLRLVSPRFNDIHEYRDDRFPDQPVAGPFVANLAGFLYACLYGLTRIRPNAADPSEWHEPGPIVLPEGWAAIEVDRLWIRGRPARLVARHGADAAELTFSEQ